MPLQHAYAITNKFTGLAAAAFALSAGSTTNRDRLNDGKVYKQWNAGSVASGLNITVDAGSAIALTAIALLNHSCASQTVNVVIKGADDSAITVNVVTVKSSSVVLGKDAVFQFASTTKRYWRLEFTWSGSFTLKIGEIFACETTALTRAITYGNRKPRRYEGAVNRTDVGVQFGTYLSGPIAGRRLIWQQLTTAQKDEVVAMWDAALGPFRDALWVEQYEAVSTAATSATEECLFGRFQDIDIEPDNDDFELWSAVELLFTEQARGVGA